MLELFETFPSYSSLDSSKLDKSSYAKLVKSYSDKLGRAGKLYKSYESNHSQVSYKLSLQELKEAHTLMQIVVESMTDEAAEVASKRATFLYDLAAALGGI